MSATDPRSETARFRKKSVEVDAMQWNGAVCDSRGYPPPPPPELTAFAPGKVSMAQVGSKTHGGPDEFLPCIRTREGTMTIRPGDWIVRGVEGEFYPCKPSTFDAIYERADAVDTRVQQLTEALEHAQMAIDAARITTASALPTTSAMLLEAGLETRAVLAEVDASQEPAAVSSEPEETRHG